ncbi:MAG: rhodanese-related sulfurtransferase [Candidatus Kapaibacteriales bacterium]
MKKETKYRLLTFYKFVDLPNPKEIVEDMYRFCRDTGMRGRVFIGEEGINATLSVNIGQERALRLFLKSIPYFQDIPFIDEKAQPIEDHAFPKMIVRYREEIVALGVKYTQSEIENHKHKISPAEFKEKLEKDPDSLAILDLRNNYEYKLGHFKGALPAATINFRDTAEFLEKYKKQMEGKEVVMYCTGGIRCEKASKLLVDAGIEKPLQLEGGVVNYVNRFDDGNWLGNLYTFDGRVSTEVVSPDNKTVIGKCHYTGEPAEDYYNCRYGPCNAQIIAIPKEYRKHMGFCSHQCADLGTKDIMIKDAEFDDLNYKQLRIDLKLEKTTLEEASAQVTRHLVEELKGVKFNHSTPPSEEEEMKEYVKEYFGE